MSSDKNMMQQFAGLVAQLALAGNDVEKVREIGVVREGARLVLPAEASIPEMIRALQTQYESEEQVISLSYEMPASPWDVGVALERALQENTGLAQQMGDARYLECDTGVGESRRIPWGSFKLATMGGGVITPDVAMRADGVMATVIHARVKRKYESRLNAVMESVRHYATTDSIHRGKSFCVEFRDRDGDLMPLPKITFYKPTRDVPMFRRSLTDAIDRNILAPMRAWRDLVAAGESLKRGVLLAGRYGTGKTLLASHISRTAEIAGWTFIYLRESGDLPLAMRLATRYEPCVIFAEDVDRVAGGEARTDEVNTILNQLDGIDSKSSRIMVVLTSNHPERLNPAMRRPGRIDVALEVLPPDAATAAGLVRYYGGDSVLPGDDMADAGKALAGQIPARIREAVQRARYESLRRTGSWGAPITSADVEAAADELQGESDLFKSGSANAEEKAVLPAMAGAFTVAGAALRKAVAAQSGNGHDADSVN